MLEQLKRIYKLLSGDDIVIPSSYDDCQSSEYVLLSINQVLGV